MIPHYFAMSEDEAREFAMTQGSGTLVTVGDDGSFHTTHLPIVWEGETIRLHVARFNDQWKDSFPRPAVMIFTGAAGFITARDYDLPEGTTTASTWDYTEVTVHGTAHLRDDREWVAEAALDLTAIHDEEEAAHLSPDYIARASRAIVGLELVVEKIEGQAKLSQNRLPGERQKISARLREHGCPRSDQLADDIDAAPSLAKRTPFVGGLRNKLEH